MFDDQSEFTLFNHKIFCVRYDCVTLAVVASRKCDIYWAKAFTLYMFQQFYKEFTPSLLKDFYGSEVFKLQDEENIKVENETKEQKKRKASDASSELESKNTKMSQEEEDRRKLILNLFSKYGKLPIEDIIHTYLKRFKSVFIQEKPSPMEKYYLSEISLINSFGDDFDYRVLFHYCFTKGTTKDSSYIKCDLTSRLTKRVISHIEKGENFQKEENKNANVKIQMYEFFFANTLLKAMKIPFLQNTYLISYFERLIRRRDTIEGKKYHPQYNCRRVNEERRRDRTGILKKYYDFFSLLFDSKILTPFSQFIDGDYLVEFKKKIKEQLSDPQSARSKSKSGKSLEKIDLPLKSSIRSKTKPRNNLIRGAETEIKHTSRFGTTPVEDISTPNIESRVQKETESVEKKSNKDHTLSLSFIGNANDQNYVIYDSAYGYNYGYKANKQFRSRENRMKKYKSDKFEADSSQVDSRSQNSKASLKIEYLISKAFTPIVPSNNYLNDISKISWNNRDLFENISCSGITESIMMGRNQGSLGMSSGQNTDKNSRNKSLIWQSRENCNINEGAMKSPHIRGNKVKQPLQYHRSMSNDRKTISSIMRSTKRNFPPIGFGTNEKSETYNNSNSSRRGDSNHHILKSNDQSSIMSPIPFDKKYFGKGFNDGANLCQNSQNRRTKNRRLRISSDKVIGGGFASEMIGISRTMDQREPMIKYTPVQLDQETPRLPSSKMYFNNSNNSKLDKSTPHSKKKRNISRRDNTLNKSSTSYIEDNNNKRIHDNKLKGFLEGSITKQRRRTKVRNAPPMETMENIQKTGSVNGSEKSCNSLKNSYRDDHPTFRQKPQTQNVNYSPDNQT